MSLLAEYGSSVEVLDFGCMFNYHIDAGTDENGHTWPNYSYRSGSIAVDGQEDQELRKVVAIPAPVTHDGSHL
jgi:hypothetical protein